MTTQRGIGILYLSFAAWVLLSAAVYRYFNNSPVIVGFDIITILCIVFFFISIWVEKTWMKIVQVTLILLVGFAVMMQGDSYFSMAILTNAFFIIYSYGWFSRGTKIKILIALAVFYCIFLVNPGVEKTSFIYIFNWLLFLIVHISCLWFVFRSTIEKAQQFDRHKEIQLSIKLDEAHEELVCLKHQLTETERQLKSAAQAGLELIEIVKELKNE